MFFFCLLHVTAQKAGTIPGEYVFKEEIGVHFLDIPSTIGNNKYSSRPGFADTTVIHRLCLNSTYGAFLERDTSFSTIYISKGYYQWSGNWQLNGDSLTVILDHLIILYPFSLAGLSSIVVEELPESIVMIGQVDEKNLYIAQRKEYEFWNFQKTEYEE